MTVQLDPLPRWAEPFRWARPERGGIFLFLDTALALGLGLFLLYAGLIFPTPATPVHRYVLAGALLLVVAVLCAAMLAVGHWIGLHYGEPVTEEDDRP